MLALTQNGFPFAGAALHVPPTDAFDQHTAANRAPSAPASVALPSAPLNESAAGPLANSLQSLERADIEGELAAAALQICTDMHARQCYFASNMQMQDV